MSNDTPSLAPNTLAFIALCNEFCTAVENSREAERTDFIESMLRLMPRLYISASDLPSGEWGESDAYIEDSLDEDYYDSVRRNLEVLFGEDDTYLDVFEEDMKYSDTPIGASISEGIADLFQVMYNFVETVREAPVQFISEAVVAERDDFEHYWSRKLCNVFRAVNALRYN